VRQHRYPALTGIEVRLMPHVPQPRDDRHAQYWELVTSADRTVDAELAAICRKEDAGEYTVMEACEARVAALEAHLAEVRRLRLEHLGGN